jgi:D-arabinose 1-dehydrogenase-like Zn-dependent alcohol dehydrogenase
MERDTIQLSKQEYEDMLDYMERMRETIEVLSDEETVKKINEALERMEKGEYLTKEQFSDV